MKKKKRLKMCALLLTAGLLSGCAAGGDTGQTADSSLVEISSEQSSGESGISEENQAEQTENGEELSESAPAEVSNDAALWDGFSKGVTGPDDYSFRNSTNTYQNDAEDRWGYVYQTVSGEKEENIIILQKKDAEAPEVVYVTDEALYYQCKYEWDMKKEAYKRRELWRVPLKKTDGYDELLFKKEKCIIKYLDLQDIYVMDSLIYATFDKDKSSEQKALERTGRSDFGIYDMKAKKWLDLGKVPKEIGKMNYRDWCGVTEEGGFLRTVKHISKGEEPHIVDSIYFVDRKTHQWKQIKKGGSDEKITTAYDSKAFFFSNGHQVQMYQGGELKDFLTEKTVDEKVHEVWKRWTEESAAWDYGENQWYLDEIRLSFPGKLQLIFNITDSKKKLTDHDWFYKANSRDGFVASKALALECPLVLEPSEMVKEPEHINDVLEPFDILYDRVDWQNFEDGLKDGEKEAFSAFLPVLTQEAEFTLFEWDGKKKKIADCKRSVMTMKKLMEKEELENYLYWASMQDFFQTGSPDLILELWGNYALILHQDNGNFYGFRASGIEDRAINTNGRFYIERKKDGKNLYFIVQYPEKKSEGEDLILQAVFQKVAEENRHGTEYYIKGKKVSEKKFEKWWGESVEWHMPRWKE